jgi:L-alanine-DL-glutamate epimerase-like enolase superfamily enzyme
LRKELASDELAVVDGKIALPRKPGFGVEVDVNVNALRCFEVR